MTVETSTSSSATYLRIYPGFSTLITSEQIGKQLLTYPIVKHFHDNVFSIQAIIFPQLPVTQRFDVPRVVFF